MPDFHRFEKHKVILSLDGAPPLDGTLGALAGGWLEITNADGDVHHVNPERVVAVQPVGGEEGR